MCWIYTSVSLKKIWLYVIFLEIFFPTILSLLSCVIVQASFLRSTHPHTFWLFLTLRFWSHVCVFRGFCEHHKIAFSKHPLLTETRLALTLSIKPVQPFPPCDSLYRFKYAIRATHVMALTGCSAFRRFRSARAAWMVRTSHDVHIFPLKVCTMFKVHFYGAFIRWV